MDIEIFVSPGVPPPVKETLYCLENHIVLPLIFNAFFASSEISPESVAVNVIPTGRFSPFTVIVASPAFAVYGGAGTGIVPSLPPVVSSPSTGCLLSWSPSSANATTPTVPTESAVSVFVRLVVFPKTPSVETSPFVTPTPVTFFTSVSTGESKLTCNCMDSALVRDAFTPLYKS